MMTEAVCKSLANMSDCVEKATLAILYDNCCRGSPGDTIQAGTSRVPARGDSDMPATDGTPVRKLSLAFGADVLPETADSGDANRKFQQPKPSSDGNSRGGADKSDRTGDSKTALVEGKVTPYNDLPTCKTEFGTVLEGQMKAGN
jgi:hypothetical protein